MDMFIKSMDRQCAEKIALWNYDKPYDIYNVEGTQEDVEEFLDGTYYVVVDGDDNIIGFFCYGVSARVAVGNQHGAYDDDGVVDIGLGMRPDLCGKGNGYEFFEKGLDFGKEKYTNNRFRLTVAEFNKRAITLYEKIGFNKVKSFERTSNDASIVFITMELCLE